MNITITIAIKLLTIMIFSEVMIGLIIVVTMVIILQMLIIVSLRQMMFAIS